MPPPPPKRPEPADWQALAANGDSHDEALLAALLRWAADRLAQAGPPAAAARKFQHALAQWPLTHDGPLQAPAGWTERQWQRACRHQLGVAPKFLQRLGRQRIHTSPKARGEAQILGTHGLDLGAGWRADRVKAIMAGNDTRATIETLNERVGRIGDVVDMIGEIALAIEMGADAVDIGKTIHPHPTLGESIGMAAEVAHGSCTDVPPARK